MGFRGIPFNIFGAGMPATSRIVGTMSMKWWNWARMPPDSSGQSSLGLGRCRDVYLTDFEGDGPYSGPVKQAVLD
jgi:hypothetical protein